VGPKGPCEADPSFRLFPKVRMPGFFLYVILQASVWALDVRWFDSAVKKTSYELCKLILSQSFKEAAIKR
jgi:hypothetical protein